MTSFPPLVVPTLAPDVLARAQSRIEELYGLVKANWQGFIERDGQVLLTKTSLETLLNARAANNTVTDGANIALLEAGTGTGKTIGYCLAAIVASEVLGMKVVVSTATVALQEQLYLKDLPRLASFIPTLTFELMKGRNRYICKSRLENLVHGDSQSSLIDDETEEADSQTAMQPSVDESTIRWYREVDEGLSSGTWNGDVDMLQSIPDDADWRTVQADANACHSKQCAHYQTCSFFSARRKAQGVNIHVANHSLVLAALSNESAMFDPSNTLFVFDEAHHLPDIATEQFSHRVKMSHALKALMSLRKAMGQCLRFLPPEERPDLTTHSKTFNLCREVLYRLDDFLHDSGTLSPEAKVHRFHNGQLPPSLLEECTHLSSMLVSVVNAATELREQLTADVEDLTPKQKEQRAKAAADLGPHFQRVKQLKEAIKAWATNGVVPLAKWVEWVGSPSTPDIELCASPLTGAQGLIKGLWRTVSAAICTSATLTACGSFDYFQRLSGLSRYSGMRRGVMPSPFNYEAQGVLHVPSLRNSPKQGGFGAELDGILPALLTAHTGGQLALFTSRRQMEASYASLPGELQNIVLMQNTRSRQQLLQLHRERIEAGEPSIIFGLQSMGEGLDLPGDLCVHVLIDRLPFTPPTSPVEEALSEWLSAQGRDAFNELSVPRTSMRLGQWVGRGVRSIHDHATITICDIRLVKTAYGRRILEGLPKFSRALA